LLASAEKTDIYISNVKTNITSPTQRNAVWRHIWRQKDVRSTNARKVCHFSRI